MGDFLDDCLNLESTFFESGFQQGKAEGRVLGRDEGRILGIKEGWDLGFELGTYLGVAEALRSKRESVGTTETTETTEKAGMAKSTAAERKLGRLVDGVYEALMASSLGSRRDVDEADLQRGDVHPRNEEMQAFVQDVRAKFKMIVSLVGGEDRLRIDGVLGGDVSGTATHDF